MSGQPTFVDLIDHNSEFNPWVFDKDPFLKITHFLSREHFIKDGGPAKTYTSWIVLENKAKLALKGVSVYLSADEEGPQANVAAQFREPDGSWGPGLAFTKIPDLYPGEQSGKIFFNIRIVRTLPGGSLNKWTLQTNFNPTYTISYDRNYEKIWQSSAQIIPMS